MSHKRRRQLQKFADCSHKGFGKFCHFCKQIAVGKAKPRKTVTAEDGSSKEVSAGAVEVPKKYWMKAKCPYCGGNRVKKNEMNAFSDNNAKEYRCTSFECGKQFNSEQVKEFEKVEVVDRPKVPWSNRLTD